MEFVNIFNVFSDKKLSKINSKIWISSDTYLVSLSSVDDLVKIYNAGLPFVRQFPDYNYKTKYLVYDFDWADKSFYDYLVSKYGKKVVRSPSFGSGRYKCKLFYPLPFEIKCEREEFWHHYVESHKLIISDYPYKNVTYRRVVSKQGRIRYLVGKISNFEENSENVKNGDLYEVHSHIDFDTSYISNLFQLTYGKPVKPEESSIYDDNIGIYANIGDVLSRMGLDYVLSKYVRKTVYLKHNLNWDNHKIITHDEIDWSTYFDDRSKAYNCNENLPFSINRVLKQFNLPAKCYKNVPHTRVLATKSIMSGHRHNYLCGFVDRLAINIIGYNNLLKQENIPFEYTVAHLYKAAKYYATYRVNDPISFKKDHSDDSLFRLCYEKLARVKKLQTELDNIEDYSVLTEYRPRFSKKNLRMQLNMLNSDFTREKFISLAKKYTIWRDNTIKRQYYYFKKEYNLISKHKHHRSNLSDYLLSHNINLDVFSNMSKLKQQFLIKKLKVKRSSLIRSLSCLY